MNPGTIDNGLIEPERYELFAEPAYRFDLDRRDFLKAVGGGIVVCLMLNDASGMQPPGARRGAAAGFEAAFPRSWAPGCTLTNRGR